MKKIIRLEYLIVAILFAALYLLSFGFYYANAEETDESAFEKQNVMEDLKGSSINGKEFTLSDYGFDVNRETQVFSFLEYRYSFYADKQAEYGLYVYVYNPQGIRFVKDSMQNFIQLTVGDSKREDYFKYPLKYLNESSEQSLEGLFYKYKVELSDSQRQNILDTLNSVERIYRVSGIELVTDGAVNATEYSVSTTYKYSGYTKGYGANTESESTLKCEVEKLETIELDVKHTFYRSQTSSLGVGHQNQLDTVYFRVPNRFLEEYGTLQRIKAEWYEYKTKEIVVTENTDFYNAAKPYIGAVLPNHELGGTVTGSVYNQDIGYSLALNLGDGGDIDFAEWGWNLGNEYLHTPCEALYYMFLVEDIQSYDPYADVTENGGVQSNTLYDYIIDYDKTYRSGTLPIKGGSISADLFETDIDESRKINNANGKIQKGYSYYDFDADVDIVTLKSWSDSSPSFWDNWINFGLGAAFTGGPTEESKTVAPIQILNSDDLSGTAEEVANNLLVNYADVTALKAEQTLAERNGETLVLFRFAQSDYYSQEVDIVQLNQGFLWSDIITSGQAYIAQESVFLDFDIIQLTFTKEGELTVIPVVSSPTDIVDGITPPVIVTEEKTNIVQIVLQLVALAVLVWIVIKLLAVIFKALARLVNNKRG